jgi:hypothetical protein
MCSTAHMPKRFKVFATVVAALGWLTLAAQEKKTQEALAGTWEGKFKGTVFCVLKLEAGSKISGTLSPGKIALNDEGEITEAEPSPQDFPILNPRVEGSKLRFEWKEGPDDPEPVQFEMKLTGDGESELAILNAGDHPIKPIGLKRK